MVHGKRRNTQCSFLIPQYFKSFSDYANANGSEIANDAFFPGQFMSFFVNISAVNLAMKSLSYVTRLI